MDHLSIVQYKEIAHYVRKSKYVLVLVLILFYQSSWTTRSNLFCHVQLSGYHTPLSLSILPWCLVDIGHQPKANHQYFLPLHDHAKEICLLCLQTWAHPMQVSLYTPTLGVYQPPIPPQAEGEDYFVPPELSYHTESLSTESPWCSPSLLPAPAPRHILGGPSIFVHPPSLAQTRWTRTPSYDCSETPAPPP